MKAVGIIVEYNPFHNGHRYHIEQARKQSGADVVIAVMSGNFVQRGAPAIFDKWTRGKMALENGVDLVVELPFASAVSSADYFAEGAVELLSALNCQALCFGTDNSSLDYQRFGKIATEKSALINQRLAALPNNLSYPAKMTKIWQEILGTDVEFNTPNHLLAISYAKANAALEQPMQLIPIERKSVGFHQLARNGQFASATAIREMIFNNDFHEIMKVVPENIGKKIKNFPTVFQEDVFNLIKYRIMTSSIADLQKIHQMKEGLEYKLKQVIYQTNSLDELLFLLKSKRYTHAFLSRLMIYILIQVSNEDIRSSRSNQVLHLLGFSEVGRTFLNQNKKSFALPVISKVGRDASNFELNLKADAVYQLLNSQVAEQNFGRLPILF